MVKQDDYLINNQEIIGGLKSAIERGENLKNAMMTFYQAGYSKTDIEEAAKAYLNQTGKVPESTTKRIQPPTEIKKPSELPIPKKMNKINPIPQNNIITKKAPQNVSSYGLTKQQKKSSRTLTITLIIILGFLLGALSLVFLFSSEFVDFFNKMFG